jgi:hypothetical protein
MMAAFIFVVSVVIFLQIATAACEDKTGRPGGVLPDSKR